MPLRFDLAIGERLYIGRGIIMSNKTRMHFVLDGDMPVLKEKDYVAPEAARTALERLYAHVQTAYLHESPAAEFRELAALAVAESPETYANLTEVDALVAAGDLYRALKSIRNLIRQQGSAHQDGVANEADPADPRIKPAKTGLGAA